MVFERIVYFLGEGVHPQRTFKFRHAALAVSESLKILVVSVFPPQFKSIQSVFLYLHGLWVFHIKKQLEKCKMAVLETAHLLKLER